MHTYPQTIAFIHVHTYMCIHRINGKNNSPTRPAIITSLEIRLSNTWAESAVCLCVEGKGLVVYPDYVFPWDEEISLVRVAFHQGTSVCMHLAHGPAVASLLPTR